MDLREKGKPNSKHIVLRDSWVEADTSDVS
jgi:hypothetical protein